MSNDLEQFASSLQSSEIVCDAIANVAGVEMDDVLTDDESPAHAAFMRVWNLNCGEKNQETDDAVVAEIKRLAATTEWRGYMRDFYAGYDGEFVFWADQRINLV